MVDEGRMKAFLVCRYCAIFDDFAYYIVLQILEI